MAARRVLGISRVEPSFNGGLTIRGVANSGRTAGYAYGYGYSGQLPVDLTFRCRTDYRGFVVDVDIDPAQPNYGQNYAPALTATPAELRAKPLQQRLFAIRLPPLLSVITSSPGCAGVERLRRIFLCVDSDRR